jgi:acyl phosphate:glycerol-3-phosphate acyltransferase
MIIALALGGYLLGSIPVAWLVTRIVSGRDLRELGSGNVGVMNTAISVHRWAGLLVFLAEAAKGALAVTAGYLLDGGALAIGVTVLAAIAGTRWPIWLRGHGGRGNTEAIAALALVSWPTLLCLLGVYLLARRLTRSSFLAMRATLVLVPVAFGLITQSWWAALFGAAFSLLFVTTHRPETDDHLLIDAHWHSLWGFITAPPRG